MHLMMKGTILKNAQTYSNPSILTSLSNLEHTQGILGHYPNEAESEYFTL